jgi:hypothetical protein
VCFLFFYFLPNAKSRFRCYPLPTSFVFFFLFFFLHLPLSHTHQVCGVHSGITLWRHDQHSQSFPNFLPRKDTFHTDTIFSSVVYVTKLSTLVKQTQICRRVGKAINRRGMTARNIDYEPLGAPTSLSVLVMYTMWVLCKMLACSNAG